MTADRNDDTLELALSRRLAEVVAGAASTEGELRLLAEGGRALGRTLEALIGQSEARLGELAGEPEAALADLASELRRVERLRAELAELSVLLERLEGRARELRGSWVRSS